MINSIQYILRRIKYAKKVNKLHFSDAGIDDKKDPWVEFDGLRFHGEPSNEKDRKYYNLLSKRAKSSLPFEAFRTAQDIIIRYIESGLMIGGPYKEDFYTVQKGDTVAEMGAFMGFFIMKMCKRVGPTGRVIAIEPLEDNVYYLKKNIEYNGFKQCSIVPKGVWKETGYVNFNRKDSDHQSGSIVITERNENHSLPVADLDTIMKELSIDHCNLMVVQLNGVEPEAIKGMTIFSPKNYAIAARYNRDGMDAVKRITKVLKERDYKVSIVNDKFIFASN